MMKKVFLCLLASIFVMGSNVIFAQEEGKLANKKLKKQRKTLLKKRAKKEEWLVENFEDNRKLAKKWKKHRATVVEEEYDAGKYADLYMQPSRPAAATYVPHKHMMSASAHYYYATDAYDSRGTNRDVAQMHFGEGPIQMQDMFLAVRLVDEKVLSPSMNTPIYFLINNVGIVTGKKEIIFNGEVEQWGTSVSLARYIWNRDVAVGVNVPFLYKKHRLNIDFNGSIRGLFSDSLKEKEFTEIGGSTSGLSDIQVFGHFNFDTPHLERSLAGVRFNIPTGQKASNNKLWGPELGNGGHFEGAAFFSATVPYKRLFNPHVFVQASASLTSHVNKRVPKKIRATLPPTKKEEKNIPLPGNVTYPTVTITQGSAKGLMTFGEEVFNPSTRETMIETSGEKIDFTPVYESKEVKEEKVVGYLRNYGVENKQELAPSPNAIEAKIDHFDTSLRNIGDHIANFKLRKGEQFNVRVGNMIKSFIFRRSFLDLFYDFRAKLSDYPYGLNHQDWNLSVYREGTQQIEHKCGFEFSYQFDQGTRLLMGADYTFAGRNVDKAFNSSLTVNYSF
jgi:hypothetical protein